MDFCGMYGDMDVYLGWSVDGNFVSLAYVKPSVWRKDKGKKEG